MDTSFNSGLSSSFLGQLVSEKLTTNNYLTWKRQIAPFIRSQDLSGHLDGSTPMPPEFFTTEAKEDGGSQNIIRNPAFVTWMKRDQAPRRVHHFHIVTRSIDFHS